MFASHRRQKAWYRSRTVTLFPRSHMLQRSCIAALRDVPVRYQLLRPVGLGWYEVQVRSPFSQQAAQEVVPNKDSEVLYILNLRQRPRTNP